MATTLKAKGNVIDLSEWITQANYARLHGYHLNTVSQWVKRAKEGGKVNINWIDIEELGLTLVKPL